MGDVASGQRGQEAVLDREYAAAIPLLNKALEGSRSPVWLLSRSQAHHGLGNYDLALKDAELCYHLAAERGSGNSRDLMAAAQYRRATALYKLGRYADSDCCARWSMLLAEGQRATAKDTVADQVDENGYYTVTAADAAADLSGQPDKNLPKGLSQISEQPKSRQQDLVTWNRAYVWRSQALGAMEKLPADHPGRKVTVTKIPVRPEMDSVMLTPKGHQTIERTSDEDTEMAMDGDEKNVAAPPVANTEVKAKEQELRIDFYQNEQTVTISVFIKDADKNGVTVSLESDTVRIGPVPRESGANPAAPELHTFATLHPTDKIDPAASTYKITPRKIELKLQKVKAGKWGSWGVCTTAQTAGKTMTLPNMPKPPSANTPSANATSASVAGPSAGKSSKQATTSTGGAPAYPTSSRNGPKNWDTLEADDEDEDAKQDVNHFFKKLYAGASPEQQRAMMKSFTESNGTSLSTDWDDVKGRTVKTQPPEGIEEKKW